MFDVDSKERACDGRGDDCDQVSCRPSFIKFDFVQAYVSWTAGDYHSEMIYQSLRDDSERFQFLQIENIPKPQWSQSQENRGLHNSISSFFTLMLAGTRVIVIDKNCTETLGFVLKQRIYQHVNTVIVKAWSYLWNTPEENHLGDRLSESSLTWPCLHSRGIQFP
ncbi:hypothetical protein K435DRAFT_858853 [Dendrothele bispora CBS 962.96]|uniref:Uncharacterized protein n=1 Tax=Dendrothele bispora (strain CBS 962.96) TaxID=1314807 RepID=A0A4S8M395_DENBC|nr:hypothetical protein K435DRAFT_858853 [Dendrothele bispora CBS 962.96]